MYEDKKIFIVISGSFKKAVNFSSFLIASSSKSFLIASSPSTSGGSSP